MNHDKNKSSQGRMLEMAIKPGGRREGVRMMQRHQNQSRSYQMLSILKHAQLFLFLLCFCVARIPIVESFTRPDDLPRLMQRDYDRIDAIDKIVQLQDPSQWIDFRKPDSLLSQILIPRIPQSEGNAKVREALISPFRNNANWTVQEHKFQAHTPEGERMMTNLIITYNIDAPRKLVLAAHHDSKPTPIGFIGATDSAVPLAIIVDVALAIGNLLDKGATSHDRGQQTGLQLLFFDGEEAYHQWSQSDSLYGSRALASEWTKTFFSPKLNKRRLTPGYDTMRMIDSIDHFVLLDLLGAPKPHIPPYYSSTKWIWDEIVDAESRLAKAGLLYPRNVGGVLELPPAGKVSTPMLKIEDGNEERASFFSEVNIGFGGIDDDHRPFLHEGVPIVHLIASPFPSVWHTMGDDVSALDYPTIHAWAMIMRVFVAEYFGIQSEKIQSSKSSIKLERNENDFVSEIINLPSTNQQFRSLNISDHPSFPSYVK